VAGEDLRGTFHMRGGGAEETLVRIDGLPVRQLFHGRDFGGITGIVPFHAVEAMNVYPGGFPAQYGGKLSGVVDIDLRMDGEPGWHGSGGANFVAARAFLENHDEHGSFFFSAREGSLDRVLDVVQDEAVIEPSYRDVLGRYVWRASPNATGSLNYLRSQDKIFYEDGLNDYVVDGSYVDDYLWSSWRVEPVESLALQSTLYASRSRQVRRIDEDGRDDQRVDALGAHLEIGWDVPGGHLLRVGGDVDRQSGRYDLASREVFQINADGDVETLTDFEESGRIERRRVAAFVQDEWKITDSFALNVGVRADHDSDSGSLEFGPRTSAAWRLPGAWLVRGAWGLYEQPRDDFSDGGAVSALPKRPDRAEHRLVGVERRFGLSRVGVDVYDKRFPSLDGIVTQTQGGVLERHVVTSGRARGAEVYVNRISDHANWWISYSLGRSEWGNAEQTFSRDFDRLHSISIANTFHLSHHWDLGMSYSYHTGTPYTEQRWRRDETTRSWTLDEGKPNARRLPDYQRFDVRVGRRFDFDRWEMTVFAEGLNLTNHDNVLWYSWGFEDRGGVRVPEREPRTGIPGVPSLGIEARF
jgi:outer membrane receptor protein involved in Fe transport